jgi:hypothetical protein
MTITMYWRMAKLSAASSRAHSSRSVLALPAIFTGPRIAPLGDFHCRGLAKRPQGVADAALTSTCNASHD